MTAFSTTMELPQDFARATASLNTVRVRPEITVTAIPAPQRLAPFAIATEADIATPDDPEAGSGRFVVLYDPEGNDAWEGVFRVVTYATVQMDPEMAADPLLGEAGWSWLDDALTECSAVHHAASGTVTRVINECFGQLSDHAASVSLEIRASWTPTLLNLGPHFEAWLHMLCQAAGLAPLPPGVTALSRRAR